MDKAMGAGLPGRKSRRLRERTLAVYSSTTGTLALHPAGAALLVMAGGATIGRTVPLADACCLIGRGAQCDIVLDDPLAGTVHACILREPEGYVVVDLASANGTFLDGCLIHQAPLADGAEILVGNSTCRFLAAAPPVADSDPAVRLFQVPAVLRHEMRHYLEILAEGCDRLKNGPADTAVFRIDAARTRLEELLEMFRTVARVPDMHPVDLDGEILQVLALYERRLERGGVGLHLELEAGERITCDPIPLRLVMTNLVLNAIEAMPSGGELRIVSRISPNAVEIRVGDNGPGVPEAFLPRIFQPLVTTKSGGMGLGLYICRHVLEGMSGTISVSNRAGGGAEFCVSWPRRYGSMLNSGKDRPHVG
ncbi:FHA domain-containing protein [bacterium]|nr:FHA domain-containing protein [candidate division CSSED10-310 bacterium]